MNHAFRKPTQLGAQERAPSGTARGALKPTSILFVCAANIYRSPAACGVMESVIGRRGLRDFVSVDSAGVIGDRIGEKAAWRMRVAALMRGHRISGRSRLIRRTDLERFDWVICMDRQVARDVELIHSQPLCQLKLVSDFLPDEYPTDIPDPVNGTLAHMVSVIRTFEVACPRIMDAVVGFDRQPNRHADQLLIQGR